MTAQRIRLQQSYRLCVRYCTRTVSAAYSREVVPDVVYGECSLVNADLKFNDKYQPNKGRKVLQISIRTIFLKWPAVRKLSRRFQKGDFLEKHNWNCIIFLKSVMISINLCCHNLPKSKSFKNRFIQALKTRHMHLLSMKHLLSTRESLE